MYQQDLLEDLALIRLCIPDNLVLSLNYFRTIVFSQIYMHSWINILLHKMIINVLLLIFKTEVKLDF